VRTGAASSKFKFAGRNLFGAFVNGELGRLRAILSSQLVRFPADTDQAVIKTQLLPMPAGSDRIGQRPARVQYNWRFPGNDVPSA
jgi:hypothetical protein